MIAIIIRSNKLRLLTAVAAWCSCTAGLILGIIIKLANNIVDMSQEITLAFGFAAIFFIVEVTCLKIVVVYNNESSSLKSHFWLVTIGIFFISLCFLIMPFPTISQNITDFAIPVGFTYGMLAYMYLPSD